MELQTVEVDGKTYALVQDGKPVYKDNGAEVAFDISGVTALRGEAMRHRQEREKAEKALKAYEGISDPAAALTALETLAKLDQKKLIDAGEVDRVRADISKAYDAKLADADKRAKELETLLNGQVIGGSFARSKFVTEKLAIPPDMVEARFGAHFKVEGGKPVAYTADGGRIHSRANPSEPADFDEALEVLVSSYAYKDHILKGPTGHGGGAQPNGRGAGAKVIKTSEFNALSPTQRAAKMAEGYVLAD